MTLRRAITHTFVAAAPLLLLLGCDSVAEPGSPGGAEANWQPVSLDANVTDAYTNAGFGFELFRNLRAEDPDGNVFASPTSAAFALAMTYNGAVGQTAPISREIVENRVDSSTGIG